MDCYWVAAVPKVGGLGFRGLGFHCPGLQQQSSSFVAVRVRPWPQLNYEAGPQVLNMEYIPNMSENHCRTCCQSGILIRAFLARLMKIGAHVSRLAPTTDSNNETGLG